MLFVTPRGIVGGWWNSLAAWEPFGDLIAKRPPAKTHLPGANDPLARAWNQTRRTNAMTGTIVRINAKGFGFIMPDHATRGGEQIFFHCKDLDDALDFDDTLVEMAVHFNVVETEKGRAAKQVLPAR
jgi:cold shock CspA family protein